MTTGDKPLTGQCIGPFGRGGSGKSTCAVLLAKAPVKAGYSVCVVDADATNEDLPQALGADQTPAPLLAWYGGTGCRTDPVICPVGNPVPIANRHVSPGQLPAKFIGQTPEGIRLFVAGKIGTLGPGAGCDGPMIKIARDFAFDTPGAAPVTVVDFKAGLEDVARGVITSLGWVVVIMDPSYPGVRTTATLKMLLEGTRAANLAATRHLASPRLDKLTQGVDEQARTQGALYVLNKVPDSDTEFFLWQRLLEAQINAIASIPEDSDLRQAWLEDLPLHSVAAEAEADKIVQALEQKRVCFAEERPTEPAAKTSPSPPP